MAVDLGTAYISLVPTTKELDRGLKSALDGTVKHADRAGDKMGAKMAANVTDHMNKAGQKSGDAFGRSFTPRVQSAGRSAMQGLANLMLGSAQGIGGEIGGTISTGLTGALNRGAGSAIDALDAIGTKGGAAMSSKLQTAGMIAAGGVALVGTAAIAATAELYRIGQAWDDLADGITAQTGAIGDRLDAITQSVKNVALETAAAPGEIAAVTSQLVQTLKLSGADLEMLTKQISDYNAMNANAPLNIRDFAKAMRQFGVTSAEEMSNQLDRLNNIAQNTGIPLNNLVSTLRIAAPVAKEFGMPLDTVTQLLATFEDAGLQAEAAAGALRIALGNIASNGTGEPPAVQLQNIINRIRELYAAGKETEAIDLAKSTFGRSFAQILPLIKENTLEVGNLDTAVASLGPTIEEQRQATSDFAEEWRKFRNFLEVELAPVAETVFGGIQNFLSYTIGAIAGNIRDIRGALSDLFNTTSGGNMSTGPAMAPPVSLTPGVLGGASGLNPINAGGGGNAASQILGGAAGALPGRGVLGTAGRGYFNSRAAAAQLEARLIDQSLLSRVPSGVYTQTGAADLTQGLADCSSAIEDLVNILDGQSTAGRSLSTHNAHEWLMSRGFRPGTAPGAFNVGFNASHMQATLPGGTHFNWGSNASAANRGIGGTGAFDPAFTAQYHRFDTGGWLPPGVTMVNNETGQPELVLNPEQQNQLAEQGVDANALLHGTNRGAAPGPAPTQGQQPDPGMEFIRSMGFIPAAAGSTGVAGTSSLSGFINMGNQVVSGVIDTGVNLANQAVSAAIALGAAGGGMGAGAAAAPIAQMAASYGIQLAGNQAKRISQYWFNLAGIGADALMEQVSPFGMPRWLGYDYTQFVPQLGIQQALTSTVERMGSDAISRAMPQPGVAMSGPGGPVNPSTMPGAAAPLPPPPAPNAPPNMDSAGPSTTTPPAPTLPIPMLPIPGLFDEGGMLPPGGIGINLTNRPEPVLTAQQWESISASAAEPNRGAPLVQNLYAQDMQDAIRKLEQTKRRDMMQYAGRP